MPNWTKEQLLAIEKENTNIIVSAGAGSGKTAVLTERVIQKLKKGIHINELLVLTFTNAAAKEMKDRIRKAIKKDPSLKQEEVLIDSAYITTFDAFSLAMVKKYHTKLNITNNIKVSDEVIIDIKKKQLLDDIFNEYYEDSNDKFLSLINNFCLKDDKDLKKYILNIYKKIELKYDKEDYLNNYIEDHYSNEAIDNCINEYLNIIKEKINSIKEEKDKLIGLTDDKFITKLDESLNKLFNAKSYEEIILSLSERLPNLPKNSDIIVKNSKESIKCLRDEIKAIAIYDNTSVMNEEIISTKSNVEVIVDIIKKLDQELTTWKTTNDIYGFMDIFILLINLVTDYPEVKEEIKRSFYEILIDEYQDTSDVQERFISLISNNNVYMVGDIKQSIYRFRNANPYIFKNKYDLYMEEKEGIKIDLNKNFRSRTEVISNINSIFNLIMDNIIGGANYKENQQMIFGNKTYIEEGKTNQNYDLDILTYEVSQDKKVTKDLQEVFILASDIKKKIEEKYLIFDKDKKVLRPIKYSDIVILIDRSKNFDLYKKVFEYFQIPLTLYKDETLKKDEDIYIFNNLIKLIICIKNNDFNEEFKYSFISLSRSFIAKISDEEIYNYFVNDSYEDSLLYKKCLLLTEYLDIYSIEEFIYTMLEEFKYDFKTIDKGMVNNYLIREEYFYKLAKEFGSTGGTIYDFCSYLNTIFEDDNDLKFSVNIDDNNSCKMMSIHKSKGLEFPICYYVNLYNIFNIRELNDRIIYDNKYGIIIPKVDNYYKNTILKTLLKEEYKKEEISEKIRLLYVALTRAKEKMIVIMPKQEEEEEALDIIGVEKRLKYNSFLSIMKSVYSAILPYIKEVEVVVDNKYLKTAKELDFNKLITEDDLVVEETDFKYENLEEKHFSKENIHLVTKEEKHLLETGTNAHSIFETIDFNSIDDWDIDKDLKEKVINFINSKLIKDNINSKMYKEYEFMYQEDNINKHGIIDLLIEGEDELIILDYKLKNIKDELYVQQLNGYRNYLKTKTDKNISCYLYSIIDNKFKEIK